MPLTTETRGDTKSPTDLLHDLQSEPDSRAIAIDKVGIRGLEIPIQIKDRGPKIQDTIGSFDLYVDLPEDVKGTHMSRFVEIIHRHEEPYSVDRLKPLLTQLQSRLKAESAFLELRFPFFLEKAAPVTGQRSLMNYQVTFRGRLAGDAIESILQVEIPVKTLCPCSKSISRYGAHNQRGVATVQVTASETVWIEEIIKIVEDSGSAQLYALLKRPDEKHVTEQAYENPVFVEDLARNIVVRLKQDPRISWYQVEAENHESIHNHNAYAVIASDGPSLRKASQTRFST